MRYSLLPQEESEVAPSPAAGPALVQPGPHSGTGELVDISSHGVSFTTSTRVSPGQRVELQVPWPALLNGQTPLKLVVHGVIVRVDQDCAAMRIRSHEFRTASFAPACRPDPP